jgi:mannose-6-phosphate isomerase-like protein (cupin superfamily)
MSRSQPGVLTSGENIGAARHENHRQRNCDEFFIVLKGRA